MRLKALKLPFFAGALFLLPTLVMAQELRIAAVNSERIMRDSQPAKAAQTKLDHEFSKRDKDLQALASRVKAMVDKQEKESASLSEGDRIKRQRELTELDRDFQRKQREFREDFNQRRTEELSVVLDRANRAIRQLAEQKKYDLVVQEAVYVSPRIDVTDEVLRILNAGSK